MKRWHNKRSTRVGLSWITNAVFVRWPRKILVKYAGAHNRHTTEKPNLINGATPRIPRSLRSKIEKLETKSE